MTTPELAAYIEEEAARGSAVAQLQLDLLARTANPFAIYVLTLIGVAIASRKVRGGVGVHLFFAVLIGFTYVFTAKLITVYAAASPVADGLVGGPENRLLLAAWLPNLLFAAFGIVLVARAPK
jgi:lipopolysaccharide export system permease protein